MAERGSILVAFLAGAIVGGLVGLLLAPASGEEMRRRIKEEAEGRLGKVKEEVETLRERAGTIKAHAEERLGEVTSKAMELFTEKKSQLSETLEKAKETIEEKKKELAEKFFRKEEGETA